MTAAATKALGLKVVGASAGSGKTFRLTKEIEQAITGQGPDAIEPEGLVAVTYTRRAHVELESRIRRALLASKGINRAAWLPRARIGTVHGVCLRWLRELALDAGVSPDVEVLADSGLALAQVLEETVPASEREELDELAERLEMLKDTREAEVHWDQPVEDVISLARNGRIPPRDLAAMAQRSSSTLLALLPQPALDGPRLDAALATAVEQALAQIDPTTDTTDKTRKAIHELRAYQRSARFGRPTWGEWLSLSKLDPGAKSRAAIAPVNAAAAAHLSHPQLHADLRRFTELVYDAAALTLERFAEWKQQRGLVDYVDMVDHTLDLLRDSAVAEDLQQKLKLVVVDELQDSSPIQLALFLRLHALAGRSTWVGDPKQCIFEYAGADPALMDAVIRWSKSAGGKPEQQGTNYRSRKGLVDLCNGVFADAFAAHGMAREDTTVAAHRGAEPALAGLPAVGLFYLDSTKVETDAEAIATGVAQLLAAPAATPVLDRMTESVRPLRPGDIAILVLTNKEGDCLAAALASLGIRATVARTGLMGTPEGAMTAAALRYLLDEEDSLAIAELEALHGWGDAGPNGWLNARLAKTALPATGANNWRAALDALRDAARVLSPQELVEGVLVALDLPTLAARWPNAPLRLANLDALRKFASVYEQRCIDDGEGCSLSGLLRFLNALTRVSYRHGDERRADEQFAGGDEGAVTVMTYHRSKGLEWPVVILGSLDAKPRPGTFEVCPESDSSEVDPDDPLAGRWIRYWPWPFANRTSPFTAVAEASPVGLAAAERERRERARLLYVGFTRARDHLVLAARLSATGPKTAWLAELQHANGPALTLPNVDDASPAVVVGADRVPARLWRLAPSPAAAATATSTRSWFSRASAGERAAYRVQPSAALASGITLICPAIREIHVIHPPIVQLARGAAEWDRVGNAFHAFLASDSETTPVALRTKRAARLLEHHGALTSYAPASLLAASDAFRGFVTKQLPSARWGHEIPIEARLDTPDGERCIDGRIDLLLETEDALVVVDHKSFPGTDEARWRSKALELAPQLATYQHALTIVRPEKPTSSWIHFVTAGAVVMFEPAHLG